MSCVCNVCAFASNIRAGVHFEPSKYYLYLRLKRVSFISVCVCVCVVHVSLLVNWVLMNCIELSPVGRPGVVSGTSVFL